MILTKDGGRCTLNKSNKRKARLAPHKCAALIGQSRRHSYALSSTVRAETTEAETTVPGSSDCVLTRFTIGLNTTKRTNGL